MNILETISKLGFQNIACTLNHSSSDYESWHAHIVNVETDVYGSYWGNTAHEALAGALDEYIQTNGATEPIVEIAMRLRDAK